jgi:hypothetical protein
MPRVETPRVKTLRVKTLRVKTLRVKTRQAVIAAIFTFVARARWPVRRR